MSWRPFLAPEAWHTVFITPWTFQKDRNVRREGMVSVKEWGAALFWICAEIFGQKWILQNWWIYFFQNGDDLPISFCSEVEYPPIDSTLVFSSSCLGIAVEWHQLWPISGWLASEAPSFLCVCVMCKHSLFMIENLETSNKQKRNSIWFSISKIIMLLTFVYTYTYIYKQKSIILYILSYRLFFHNNNTLW